MKVIIDATLSDYIETKLIKAYHRGGEYLKQGALFRSRLYSILKEFESSNLSECAINFDGSLSYTPPNDYLCGMNFVVGYDYDAETRYLILRRLDWTLNEWVFGYFIQILSEMKKTIGRIITETINQYLKENLV